MQAGDQLGPYEIVAPIGAGGMGGRFPVWSRGGHELLFRKPGEGLQAVTHTTKGDTFTASPPRVWTSVSLRDDSGFPSYDLAPDGKRIATFLAIEDSPARKPLTHLTFLLNFFDELQRKAPRKK